MTPNPWPWEECGESFYGWADPAWVSHMDFSILRWCNYPKGHRGACDWSPDPPCRVLPAAREPEREADSIDAREACTAEGCRMRILKRGAA